MAVRHARPGDAAQLSAFGRRIFHDTFAPDNNPADLAAYLDTAYTEERQLAEIRDPGIVTLLLEHGGGLAAFAQLRSTETEPGIAGTSPIELWRFYVDPAWHGKGVAAGFMADVEDEARQRGADVLWLGVWEKNLRAQAFYRKCGFTVVGSHVFVVGSDPQRDLVMSKALGDTQETGGK